jgi:hypothetical protein
MSDFIPPDAAVAEWVDKQRRAEKALERRLRDASPEQLEQLARDANEPAEVRISALSRLVDPFGRSAVVPEHRELADMLLGFLADLDPEMRRMALHLSRHFWPNPRVKERVRCLLDDAEIHVRAEAAMVLAMKHDAAVLPYLLAWFHGDDQPHRNVAMQGFRWVNTPEARHVLRESYEQGGRGKEDRIGLATALLWAGDPCGVPFLEEVAHRAKGIWSVVAVSALYGSYRAKCLKLMRWVLDRGDQEAKRGMVSQIYTFSCHQLIHAFTADGIHEARCWIDHQMELKT